MKSKSGTMRVLVIVTLVVLSLAYLLPIYVTVVTSLKSIEEFNRTNYLVPTDQPTARQLSRGAVRQPALPQRDDPPAGELDHHLVLGHLPLRVFWRPGRVLPGAEQGSFCQSAVRPGRDRPVPALPGGDHPPGGPDGQNQAGPVLLGIDHQLPDPQHSPGVGAAGDVLLIRPPGAGRVGRGRRRFAGPDLFQYRGSGVPAGLCLGGHHHLHPGLE